MNDGDMEEVEEVAEPLVESCQPHQSYPPCQSYQEMWIDLGGEG